MNPDKIAAARDRYQREREKRLRTDGIAQYREFTGELEDFDRDPWVEPGFTRESVVEERQAVIVGAGFGGMLTAVELTKLGIRDFRIIEKAGDFGGTWYWNRYPGCMCDVESYTYMPLLEETGYMPTEKYASATEIFEHCQRIGRQFELYDHALFQTEIATAEWDDEAARWQITTTRGDRIAAEFLITAGGILHKAKLPGIEGIETFAGRSFHTARWDYDYTGGSATTPMDNLEEKTVGIIGTGATAVQVVPQLARTAKDVFVFQRTPSAVGVRNNGPTDAEWFAGLEPGWQAERMRNFTAAVTGEKPERDLVGDGWTEVLWENTNIQAESPEQRRELDEADFEVMEQLRRRVDETVDDPATAEKLKPWYGKHCKRVCFHDDYLAAFNEPNVHLVDTDGLGVREIGPGGPVVDGVDYDLDLLIFASGFEVTTGLVRRLGFDPVGRNGITLGERWSDGAHTLHGVLSADFPNLLVISTVQAGFGTNFVHFLSESAKHVAWIVATCEEEGITSIEATPEAEDEWLDVLYGVAMGLAEYSLTCTPGYYNSEGSFTAEGARNLVYPGSLMHYAGYLERWRDEGEMAGTRITRGTRPESGANP
ncbi:MAG: NAD(P)/FAD-dependent oxidoreductase [Acidimicrobiales bacterium]